MQGASAAIDAEPKQVGELSAIHSRIDAINARVVDLRGRLKRVVLGRLLWAEPENAVGSLGNVKELSEPPFVGRTEALLTDIENNLDGMVHTINRLEKALD